MRIGSVLLALCMGAGTTGGMCFAQEYEFKGGYPTPETIRRAYDDADLARASPLWVAVGLANVR